MTTVAINQPYLFPYVGYYQLVAAADVFVLLDDVTYRKGGFINRNTIIDKKGSPIRFTLPVRGASSNRPIRDHFYGTDNNKTVRSIDQCYQGKPGYATWSPIIHEILSDHPNSRVSDINEQSVRRPLEVIGLQRPMYRSSQLDPERKYSGAKRVIHICKLLEATRYINLPGGQSLYDANHFAEHEIQLGFMPQPPAEVLPDGSTIYPSLIHYLMTDDDLLTSASRLRPGQERERPW